MLQDEQLMPKQTTIPSGSAPQKELNTHSTLKMRPQPWQTLHKQKSPTKSKFKKSMKPTRFEANIKKLESIASLTASDPDDEYEKYGRHIAAQLHSSTARH